MEGEDLLVSCHHRQVNREFTPGSGATEETSKRMAAELLAPCEIGGEEWWYLLSLEALFQDLTSLAVVATLFD